MKLKYYNKKKYWIYFYIMKQVGVTVNLKDIGHGLMVVHLWCWPAAQTLHKKYMYCKLMALLAGNDGNDWQHTMESFT